MHCTFGRTAPSFSFLRVYRIKKYDKINVIIFSYFKNVKRQISWCLRCTQIISSFDENLCLSDPTSVSVDCVLTDSSTFNSLRADFINTNRTNKNTAWNIILSKYYPTTWIKLFWNLVSVFINNVFVDIS